MIGTRSALLAASLFIAAPAVAAPPDQGHYVWVPAGASVVLVPAARPQPVDFPVARLIAQQEAMMDQMMADMVSLMAMPLPGPNQMIHSAMQGLPQMVPGTGVVVTSVISGSGTCSQTMTYDYPGQGGQPTIQVSSTGNACGAVHPGGPVYVVQPAPAPQPTVMQPKERLWTVGYPPKPIKMDVPPRS